VARPEVLGDWAHGQWFASHPHLSAPVVSLQFSRFDSSEQLLPLSRPRSSLELNWTDCCVLHTASYTLHHTAYCVCLRHSRPIILLSHLHYIHTATSHVQPKQAFSAAVSWAAPVSSLVLQC
jgi:hypothetical protein